MILNTKGLVKKKKFYIKKTKKLENKIPSVTELVTTTLLNRKLIKIENKILGITNLAPKSAVNRKAAKSKSK